MIHLSSADRIDCQQINKHHHRTQKNRSETSCDTANRRQENTKECYSSKRYRYRETRRE